jgi:hypothetical protein
MPLAWARPSNKARNLLTLPLVLALLVNLMIKETLKVSLSVPELGYRFVIRSSDQMLTMLQIQA